MKNIEYRLETAELAGPIKVFNFLLSMRHHFRLTSAFILQSSVCGHENAIRVLT
jgi:hypothetical protein